MYKTTRRTNNERNLCNCFRAYSDWEILGFCETEEEAIKSCIKYNRGLDEDDTWDGAYYMKTNKFDVGTLELIKPNYVHTVRANHYPDGWRFDEDVQIRHDPNGLNHIRIVRRPACVQCYPCDDYATINVCLKEINRPKALKIAQDMLYQKLAEEEGL